MHLLVLGGTGFVGQPWTELAVWTPSGPEAAAVHDGKMARAATGTADATAARVESDPDGLLIEVPIADVQVWAYAGQFLGVEHPARRAHLLRGLL